MSRTAAFWEPSRTFSSLTGSGTRAPWRRSIAPSDTLAVLQTAWPELLQKWISWADALTDQDMDRVVEYQGADGKAFRNTVTQIVLHLVNHATLHRGQAMAMLRQLGIKPPGTDLIFYYRGLEAK